MVTPPMLAVTGASGFLGMHFVRAANERGYAVREFGRKPSGEPAAWRAFDLADREPLDPAALAGMTAVVHFAAHIPRDMYDAGEAERCFNRNALGTLRLMDAAQAAGVQRFVHLVGANAYASGVAAPDESAQLLPTHRGTFYLMSKVCQEAFAAHHAVNSGMSVAALRVSTPYSAARGTGPIAGFTRTLLAGEPLRIANGGRYGTDWIEVADVVAAVFIALEKGVTGPLNVGSGIRTTLAELAQRLTQVLAIPAPQIELEPVDRPLDIGFPALNIDRIGTRGFMPANLNDVLARDVETLRKAALAFNETKIRQGSNA